jgi:hypothetical protein
MRRVSISSRSQMLRGRAYGLLGRASGWELHLLGLGLLNFLGRHIGNMEDSGVQKDVADAIGWVVMK